jgi:hypothetical protein
MTSIHKLTIERLERRYPEARTTGFRGAVGKLLFELDEPDDWRPTIVPDCGGSTGNAYPLSGIEVEDRHPINAHRLSIYEDLWWLLDDAYWELHLISADRWGNLTPISIFEYGAWSKLDLQKLALGERDRSGAQQEASDRMEVPQHDSYVAPRTRARACLETPRSGTPN